MMGGLKRGVGTDLRFLGEYCGLLLQDASFHHFLIVLVLVQTPSTRQDGAQN